MSRETTEARFTARAADQAWVEHVRGCPQCAAVRKARFPLASLCIPEGIRIRQAQLDANADLDRERELDKLPILGQEALW